MQITVRPQERGDGTALARAWLDAGRYYAALDPQTFQMPASDGLAEFFEGALTAGNGADAITVVAEVGGRVVGAGLARIERPVAGAPFQMQRHLGHSRLVVDVVVVEEAYRRRGVGARLMGALEEWGRRRGATVSLLDNYPENALALPFFEEGLGYRRQAVRLTKAL